MTNSYFNQELRICFPGARLKKPAKRVRTYIGHCSNFIQLDLALEIFNGVIVYRIDAFALPFAAIVLEPKRGKRG
jgi:hypothetical protein